MIISLYSGGPLKTTIFDFFGAQGLTMITLIENEIPKVIELRSE
jgi:hypothetical protein